MGNYLGCLVADGAKRTKASDATEHKPRSSCVSLRRRFRNSRKTKHGCHASTARGTSAQASGDDSKHPSNPSYLAEGEKGFIRVKVVLTKKEASQLLSNFIGGEQKMLEYISNELERMQGRRPEVKLDLSGSGWRPALDSIPENC